MRMQKGLCIELNEEFAIFMGQNGEFVQGRPAGKIAVGEEGLFYPAQLASTNKHKTRKPVWAPVIAALAVAVLFLSVLLPRQEAFAYVQIQVNPGIELGIDEEYEVVSVRDLNADGRELIGELGDWKNHPLEEVLDEVIALSMKETTDEIVITTVADEEDEVADEAVVDSVMAISAKAMAKNVTVKLKEASKKQWRTSVEKSVPVGQLISNSQKLKSEKAEDNPAKEKNGQLFNEKENQPANDKQMEKDLKSAEKAEKKEEQVKVKEDKEKADAQAKNSPSGKEKEVPRGQEKRQETPAAEKGNPNPPGQEKRHEAPGQIKKEANTKTDGAPVKKEVKEAPGQQKKKDNKGDNKEKSSKAQDNKEKSKPAVSGQQDSKVKSNSAQPNGTLDKPQNDNKKKNMKE
ncbi:hypothetical protein [Planomicrobium sp. Y74]|uniref:anti-sigma-I factor RsgI family protein n=1 Tax=Planomicrobium sp. Y74 TaxID=2478977 RepID=UPI000EF48455|nr:hypothetical protein [Planomicrobium sp. Y74]RLQ92936.1 hypothetical protein D9754_02645 [Planomicrobium sp. Y74]